MNEDNPYRASRFGRVNRRKEVEWALCGICLFLSAAPPLMILYFTLRAIVLFGWTGAWEVLAEMGTLLATAVGVVGATASFAALCGALAMRTARKKRPIYMVLAGISLTLGLVVIAMIEMFTSQGVL